MILKIVIGEFKYVQIYVFFMISVPNVLLSLEFAIYVPKFIIKRRHEMKGNYRSHCYLVCFSRAVNHPQPVEGSPYKPQRPPAAPPSPAAYTNYPPNHNSLRYVLQQSPYGTTVPYRENPYSVRTPVSSSIQAL